MQKIECHGLSASYGKKSVLKNVTLELFQGEFASLCGPNGSGKSTLLSILANIPNSELITRAELYPSFAGTLEGEGASSGDATGASKEPSFEGASVGEGVLGSGALASFKDYTLIKSLKRKEIARSIAFLQQNETCIWDFTVLQYVLQGRYAYSSNGIYSAQDNQLAMDCLESLGLADFSDRTVHTLSGGEFQKVRLARALAQSPKFLLLDEPASALDFVYEPQLMSLLRELAHERGIGILASVHDVNLASEYVDKMNMLSAEGIISGSPSQIMKAEVLEKIYGVPFVCKEKSSFQSSL
ncbi:MAG: ABC transporter ATP-binding protein [Treponema sp.]|nr:ABC transporter ATP-binding protein [Treponema sp.]